MADLQITISNTIDLFGGNPSNDWLEYDWNEFLWGEGTQDVIQSVTKPIGSTLTLSTVKSLTRFLTLSSGIALTSDPSPTRMDGSGYSYGTAPAVSWSLGDVPLDTWTEITEPTTNWS